MDIEVTNCLRKKMLSLLSNAPHRGSIHMIEHTADNYTNQTPLYIYIRMMQADNMLQLPESAKGTLPQSGQIPCLIA